MNNGTFLGFINPTAEQNSYKTKNHLLPSTTTKNQKLKTNSHFPKQEKSI